jgi:hypothetical protein
MMLQKPKTSNIKRTQLKKCNRAIPRMLNSRVRAKMTVILAIKNPKTMELNLIHCQNTEPNE